ncbi:hypothetical protein [Sphingomonas sp.]
MSSPNPSDETGAMGMAEPLEAWCFIGARELWALTGDETGANLPDEHAP